MQYKIRSTVGLFFAVVLLTLAGCLSLGGKTTYTTESPETKERINALETRVGVLERAVIGTPPGPMSTSGNMPNPNLTGNLPANSIR
jgi:hypothetical protein